jgi:hypothetical protein
MSGEKYPLGRFGLCYLATPYTKFEGGINLAFAMTAELAGRLLMRGVKVYSPICHTHPIAIHGGLDPLDHAIWLPFDQAMMERSDVLVVGMMAGWEKSFGIAHEIEYFTTAAKPVCYLDPSNLEIVAAINADAA